MPKKIIIDTDPGIDDAMAIFFALKSPELDVLGLTTTFGNGHTSLTTLNALRLLEIADRPDVPVAKGSDHALIADFDDPGAIVHGDDGQGNLNLPMPTTEAIPESAAEFIVESVQAHPDEVTLVAIGPLTNLALALRLDSQIADKVAGVVLMGGNAFTQGNISPAAEANIYHDPEAADVVFGAGWDVTMVGLDVTHQVYLSPEDILRYGHMKNPLAQHISQILPFYQAFYKQIYGFEGIYVHDSTAIAYLLAPDAFETHRLPVRVETQGFSRGKTWVSNGTESIIAPWENRPLVNVCVNVDAKRTLALEWARMADEE
ncbi:MAG: nucleoside hydrolase [Aggregatilineales bacterium]